MVQDIVSYKYKTIKCQYWAESLLWHMDPKFSVSHAALYHFGFGRAPVLYFEANCCLSPLFSDLLLLQSVNMLL